MNPRYVLEFLRHHRSTDKPRETLTCEIRLVCSGKLYADPPNNVLSRVLLREPFGLFVAESWEGNPNHYPQELALRARIPIVQERSKIASTEFYPLEEVAQDLAALLTLLCRRLITVAGVVST